jgi:hypothetical protein
VAELNALEEARKVIAQRASDPRAKMVGLSSDLLVIGRALNELDQRTANTTEAHLLMYEHIASLGKFKAPSALLDVMSKVNRRCKMIALRINHGRSCGCDECLTVAGLGSGAIPK